MSNHSGIKKKSFKCSLCNEGGENIMTIHIRRVLIEALKARETSLVELSQAICATNGVEECDIVVTDVDAKTETIKLTVRGANIEYSGIVSILQENGVSVKGVDEVNVSKVKQIFTKTNALIATQRSRFRRKPMAKASTPKATILSPFL